MFERFTDRARKALVRAQEEARLLGHNFIGTEHILLGVLHDGDDLASHVLASMGIDFVSVQAKVRETVGPTASGPQGNPPFTPRAKKVLELSLREALQLGHNYIGTEHMLLGLLSEGEGVAVQALTSLGADLASVRSRIVDAVGVSSARASGHQDLPSFEGFQPTGSPAPRCRCGAALAEFGRWRTVAFAAGPTEPDQAPISLPVVYCGQCGLVMGTAPAPAPGSGGPKAEGQPGGPST
ncbi:MAG: Clp protease N-terminal domain-containing protein [Acidimicrobiales bacterium]